MRLWLCVCVCVYECECTRAYTTCIYTVLGCGITVGVNQLTKQTPYREAMCVIIMEKNAPPSVTTHTHTHICAPSLLDPLPFILSLACCARGNHVHAGIWTGASTTCSVAQSWKVCVCRFITPISTHQPALPYKWCLYQCVSAAKQK